MTNVIGDAVVLQQRRLDRVQIAPKESVGVVVHCESNSTDCAAQFVQVRLVIVIRYLLPMRSTLMYLDQLCEVPAQVTSNLDSLALPCGTKCYVPGVEACQYGGNYCQDARDHHRLGFRDTLCRNSNQRLCEAISSYGTKAQQYSGSDFLHHGSRIRQRIGLSRSACLGAKCGDPRSDDSVGAVT